MTATCAALYTSQAWRILAGDMSLKCHARLHGSTLTALLGRLPRVTRIFSDRIAIVLPLTIAIFLGRCKQLREFYIYSYPSDKTVSSQALNCLGTAIEAGFLPALEVLDSSRTETSKSSHSWN
jgi:hypothetical protein